MSAPPLNSDHSSGNANNNNPDLDRVTSPAIDEAPPPGYDAATAAGSSAVRREQRQANMQAEQGGSAPDRSSDVGRDERPLPEGWIKLWNSLYQHFYYVDTSAQPPRSIWTHPLDDAAFLKANPQFQDMARGARGRPSEEDGGINDAPAAPSFAPPAHAPPPQINSSHHKSSGMTRQQRIKAAGDKAAEEARNEPEATGLKKISRHIKENTTGKDRVARRREAAEKAEAQKIVREERRAAAQAFIRAAQTGQPQLVGTDERNGTVYYAEPPAPGVPVQMVLNSFPPPYGFESRKEGNTTYMRPAAPPMYAQRGMYGGGYGGYGMGMPLMGGMLGGALLGGMLF